MKQIVDILSFNSKHSKPPKAEVQTLDVVPLLTTVFEMLGFAARAAGVQLTVEMPPCGVCLLGDRSRLLQVLLNLVANAIQAAGPGGLVTLAARPEENRVILEITDRGPSIPPEVEARIWEPFSTTKTKGRACGLAIVRSLVNEMAGTMQVESRPHWGTVFRLCFPTAAEPDGNPRSRKANRT